MAELAIKGGLKAITLEQEEARRWPIITDEEERVVTDMLRRAELSSSENTYKFEEEFAQWCGVKYALAHTNGTAALHAALYAVGVEPGDEVIVQSYTHPFSVVPILACNAIPVFCDVERETMCTDPDDVKKRITSKTKAILPVHLGGIPCEMDDITEIARTHGLAVVEDACVSHGATYKGKKVGSIGDTGAFSMQVGKLLPGGEGGLFVTDNEEYLSRAILLGHYERRALTEKYNKYSGISLGHKYRISALAAAIARVQLKYLDERLEIRRRNAETLIDKITRLPGLQQPYTPPYVGRAYGRAYVKYVAEELGGLEIGKFVKALQAEGARVGVEGGLRGLHLHQTFQDGFAYCKGYRAQGPNVTSKDCGLPPSRPPENTISLPVFTSAEVEELLGQYVEAFTKVTSNVDELIAAS